MDRPPLQRQGSRVRFAEGQEFVPSPPPPPSSTTATATSATNQAPAATAPSPPGVYWDDLDRDSTTGGKAETTASSSANYTFYREGTPPPHPESSDYEKLVLKHRDREQERDRDVGGPGYPSVLSPVPIRPASAFPPYEVSKFDPNDPGPGSDDDGGGEGSLGRESREREARAAKRKKYRWLFLVVALLFVAIPVGVGTGVALGLRKSGSSSGGGSSAATSPSTSPEPTPSPETPIPTSTPTSSTPAATSPDPPRFVPGLITCPDANNTLYLVPGSTKTFLRNCAIDYDGTDGGAYDLSHVYTTSMEQCMNVCASSDLCTGCGWGFIEGDKKGNYRCWMKNNLQTPHKAREDYCFAVLQD